MNRALLLSLVLLALTPFSSAYSYRKAITFKKKDEWIDLGKITTTGDSNIRAMLITYSDVVTSRKPDLTLLAFGSDTWHSVSRAKDCTDLKDDDHYTLQLFLNDTYVNANRILFREPTMRFVATNCFSPYSSNLQGRPIDLEITECTYELPEEDESVVEKSKKPEPKEEHPEEDFKLFAYSEREVKVGKFKIPNLVCLIILGASLLLSSLLAAKTFCNSVHFILILSVLMRIVMHVLLFLELTMGFVETIVSFLDVASQFGFVLSCISIIFSYPSNSPKLAVIFDILTAVLYYFLGRQTNLFFILGLRGGIGLVLILAAILGVGQKNRITSKGCGLAVGLVFLGWLTFVESLLVKCAGSESILMDRIELVTDYPLCSNKHQWAVKFDYVFQAGVMALAMVASGFTAKP
eukprot:TRINITY_DN1200_c0_g4_i1.p1 TRINITY_DN1200_c0_g4~~TRINITY_DN1200_c0_g4_i1.p1  ORF type:complete len:408 (-),score=126.07 TRINITY_DN1200_c0_g4_i1:84-1307(-)